MDDLRGSPLSVGTLEEMIDDNHAIVSSSVGPEYYVNVMSFVNQDLLEPGSSVLLHNKVCTLVRKSVTRVFRGWLVRAITSADKKTISGHKNTR